MHQQALVLASDSGRGNFDRRPSTHGRECCLGYGLGSVVCNAESAGLQEEAKPKAKKAKAAPKKKAAPKAAAKGKAKGRGKKAAEPIEEEPAEEEEEEKNEAEAEPAVEEADEAEEAKDEGVSDAPPAASTLDAVRCACLISC